MFMNWIFMFHVKKVLSSLHGLKAIWFLICMQLLLSVAKFKGFWMKLPSASTKRKTLAGRALSYSNVRFFKHFTVKIVRCYTLSRKGMERDRILWLAFVTHWWKSIEWSDNQIWHTFAVSNVSILCQPVPILVLIFWGTWILVVVKNMGFPFNYPLGLTATAVMRQYWCYCWGTLQVDDAQAVVISRIRPTKQAVLRRRCNTYRNDDCPVKDGI